MTRNSRGSRLPPRLWLAGAAALLAVALTTPLPVLDEESYLAIAGQLDPVRPYDWWRPWPPWNGGQEADAFVYAHPPGFLLQVWAWLGLVGGQPGAEGTVPVGLLKSMMGLPWALLFGWTAGRLAERTTDNPGLAAAAWLSTPVVMLGLQRGLMPDLPLAALMTYSVVAWLEATAARSPLNARPWYIGSAVALGLAATIKYPALVLLGAFVLHGWATRRLGDSRPFWVTIAAIFVAMESWLAATYGRVHIVEVISRAGEIPRGPASGRLFGTLVRLPFAVAALALVGLRWSTSWAIGLALGALGAATLPPEGTSSVARILLALFAGCGLVGLFAAGRAVARGVPLGLGDSLSPSQTDALLLGSWALLWIGGVVVGHNFAGPRYLLPAALPLVLLVVRATGRRRSSRRWLGLVVGLQAVVGLGLSWTERLTAESALALAEHTIEKHDAPGAFTGEWAFRWRMEQAGWRFFTGEAEPGEIVAVPRNHAPGPVPQSWTKAKSIIG